MIQTIGRAATSKLIERISGQRGLNAQLAELSAENAAMVDPSRIRTYNVAQELAERSEAVQYPAVQVYCEKIINKLTEKFRSFSGSVHVAMDVKHSQDRIDGIEQAVELYVEAATRVLRESRGDWGQGMFYGGAYEVTIGPVKRGGKHFIQAAKITFEIGVSRN
jgi:hypothetical protein